MTLPDHLIYAHIQMKNADQRLKTAEDTYSVDSEADNFAAIAMSEFYKSNIIHDCQICIEQYVKVSFKSVDVNPPEKHAISFKKGKRLINRDLPDGFEREHEIPKAILLTQFWRQFYEESKYGNPETNVHSDQLLRSKDAERAIEDANFCKDLARDLYEAAKAEVEEESDSE